MVEARRTGLYVSRGGALPLTTLRGTDLLLHLAASVTPFTRRNPRHDVQKVARLAQRFTGLRTDQARVGLSLGFGLTGSSERMGVAEPDVDICDDGVT